MRAHTAAVEVLSDDARPLRRRFDHELSGQLLLHRGDMADEADGPAALAEFVERAHREVEGVVVERAEALVDEQGVELHTAGAGSDDLGEAESQGQ